MNLLAHNKKAYNGVQKHLKTSNRTCVIHPTGTGKSMIALQLIEDNPNSRILYITSVATNLLEFWDKVDALNHVNAYHPKSRVIHTQNDHVGLIPSLLR